MNLIQRGARRDSRICGFNVALAKPLKHRAYRHHVRTLLHLCATGRRAPEELYLWPERQHILTAWDVA